MNKEQAISCLITIKMLFDNRYAHEALDMAIEALSKPTCKKCEDLISRKQAIDELNEFIKPFVGLIGDMGAAINGAREVIKDIPSIEAIPCEVANKVGEENERLTDRIGELEEQVQAMEALQVKTDGDIISRQWLLDLYGDYIGDNGEPKYHVPLEVVRQNIKDAPSAEAVHIEAYRELYEKYVSLKHELADEKWVPCSEQLPSEKDGEVLVTKCDEVRIATYSEFSDTWYVGEMCAVGGEDPIAWKPKPTPYKKSEVEE